MGLITYMNKYFGDNMVSVKNFNCEDRRIFHIGKIRPVRLW
jgi:hypothetical protein